MSSCIVRSAWQAAGGGGDGSHLLAGYNTPYHPCSVSPAMSCYQTADHPYYPAVTEYDSTDASAEVINGMITAPDQSEFQMQNQPGCYGDSIIQDHYSDTVIQNHTNTHHDPAVDFMTGYSSGFSYTPSPEPVNAEIPRNTESSCMYASCRADMYYGSSTDQFLAGQSMDKIGLPDRKRNYLIK